jgi:hypothetical protein
VPLFRHFNKVNGNWEFNAEALRENLKTILDVDRPVVLYLSANHFIDAGQALCGELATDPVNLMWNRDGPMFPQKYFGNAVIAWTLTDYAAPVNRMRRQALMAAVEAIGDLPEPAQKRIVAVSILGEVHHMFAGFYDGPGFNSSPAAGTDYSPSAVSGFRTWLAQTYSEIAGLNRELRCDFVSFDAINPPSKDVNTEKLDNFFEHVDSHASGNIIVYGWLHDSLERDLTISVNIDGEMVGVAESGLSRTDVTDQLPAITRPNVGFRMNLDYRDIAPGIHSLEVLVSVGGMAPLLLAKQQLVIMNRDQKQPKPIKCVDHHARPIGSDSHLSGSLDGPLPAARVLYNPLARLWLIYRNQVVRNYIEYFAQIARRSGIPRDKIFSHQITPELTGSWNADLLAAEASKLPSSYYAQGTTLYGGAAFGSAFATMKSALGWGRYAVNEMHPMIRLSDDEYLAMFEMHRRNGAVFVAPYYMYIGPSRSRPGKSEYTHDRFRIASDNPHSGSDAYWHAIQNVMKQ